MLEPFSRRRFGLGWVAVVDPLATVLLLAGGIGAWLLHPWNPWVAWYCATGGILLAGAYVMLGAYCHHRAVQVAERRAKHLGPAIAVDASAQIGTIFLWRLLYRTRSAFYLARYNSITGSLKGEKTIAVSLDPHLSALLSTPRAAAFTSFASQLTLPRIDADDPDALIIEDMRFAFPTDAAVGLWALRIAFAHNRNGTPRIREMHFLQRHAPVKGSGPIRQRVSPVPMTID